MFYFFDPFLPLQLVHFNIFKEFVNNIYLYTFNLTKKCGMICRKGITPMKYNPILKNLFKKIFSVPSKFFTFVKRHRIYVISAITMVLISVALTFSIPYIKYITRDKVTTDYLDTLGLNNINNLMIVAHPDDEVLWGGNALLLDDYLVVCLTNGDNSTRHEEFNAVMLATNDIGIILSYPDKIMGKRSDWEFCKDGMYEDLKTIIDYKNWNVIVTHNENGEYGHRHHVMTHNMVQSACDFINVTSTQFYFGKYYKKSVLNTLSEDELPTSLSDDYIAAKAFLTQIYDSQSGTLSNLEHMIPYENWNIR